MALTDMLDMGSDMPMGEGMGMEEEGGEDTAKAEAGRALADALGVEVKDPVALCNAVKQIMELEYEPEM